MKLDTLETIIPILFSFRHPMAVVSRKKKLDMTLEKRETVLRTDLVVEPGM